MPEIEIPALQPGDPRSSRNAYYQAPVSGSPVQPDEEPPEVGHTIGAGPKRPRGIIFVAIGVVAIVIFGMLMIHPPSRPKTGTESATGGQATAPARAAPNPPAAPTGDASPLPSNSADQPQPLYRQGTAPADIEATRKQPDGEPLSSVDEFSQGGEQRSSQWTAPPYKGSGAPPVNNSAALLATQRRSQVSTPSLVFVLSTPNSATQAGPASAPVVAESNDEPVITNLGYQPGFHIIGHLESVATTATKTPVIAVVDYNYRKNGVVVIPSGSRVIGELGDASSTGVVGAHFSSVLLPNGEEIAISAVGLDQRMGPLKGVVTGRNRGKQILLATLGGLGSTAAALVGNNTSASLSEGDVMRNQVAQNIGTAADSQIQGMAVSEHIVVSLPAGTQIQVMFVAPGKKVAKAAGAEKE